MYYYPTKFIGYCALVNLDWLLVHHFMKHFQQFSSDPQRYEEVSFAVGLGWCFSLSWLGSRRWGLLLLGNADEYGWEPKLLARKLCGLSAKLSAIEYNPKTTKIYKIFRSNSQKHDFLGFITLFLCLFLFREIQAMCFYFGIMFMFKPVYNAYIIWTSIRVMVR